MSKKHDDAGEGTDFWADFEVIDTYTPKTRLRMAFWSTPTRASWPR